MKPPLWKKILSYVTELHVESASSPYNERLHVSLVKGRYQLSTDSVIYSYGDKYDNFRISFEQMDLDKIEIKDVLILGFGLGSIPVILEQKLNKQYNYTGIEIDEEVIYLASKYILPDLRSDIHIIEADALNFLELNQQKFDLIAMDIFVDDVIPEVFQSHSFLHKLKENLTSSGIVMYNRLSWTDKDKKTSLTFFDDAFSEVFPEATAIHVKGNHMLVSKRSIVMR